MGSGHNVPRITETLLPQVELRTCEVTSAVRGHLGATTLDCLGGGPDALFKKRNRMFETWSLKIQMVR